MLVEQAGYLVNILKLTDEPAQGKAPLRRIRRLLIII